MTEEEYNEALKELGVVLLDVDYAKLKTTLEVAKIVIHLNKINERIVLEDNDFYQKENAELKAQNKDLCDSLDIMNNRESELLAQIKGLKNNIDGQKARKYHYMKENAELKAQIEKVKSFSKIDKEQILKQYEEIENLKAQIEKMKCCENCKHYKYECENGYYCDLGVIEKWKTYHKKCNKWEIDL